MPPNARLDFNGTGFKHAKKHDQGKKFKFNHKKVIMKEEQTKVEIDKSLKVDRDLLNRRILFRKAIRPDRQDEEIRRSLTPLNKIATVTSKEEKVKEKKQVQVQEDGFNKPAKVLFRRELINDNMEWASTGRAGAGFANFGNTCFLNSVMQCLVHTAPLANQMAKKEHTKTCPRYKEAQANGRSLTGCGLCAMESLCAQAFSGRKSIRPVCVAGPLKSWGKHFRKGRQEDAHEFLRYFMDAMQKACLIGQDKKLDIRIQETTLIHQIFGGYLCSSVTCTECGYASNTYEASLDMSLEIAKGVITIEDALAKFTAKEKLAGENKYNCERCKQKVVAVKQMRVYQPPNILSLHLKRFDYVPFGGGKLNKKITFGEILDLSPYMVKGSARYRLFGVILHHGHSTHSGHYVAYVKARAGHWILMDDDDATMCSQKSVLNCQAYMLFYQRITSLTATTVNKPTPIIKHIKEEISDLTKALNQESTHKTTIKNQPTLIGVEGIKKKKFVNVNVVKRDKAACDIVNHKWSAENQSSEKGENHCAVHTAKKGKWIIEEDMEDFGEEVGQEEVAAHLKMKEEEIKMKPTVKKMKKKKVVVVQDTDDVQENPVQSIETGDIESTKTEDSNESGSEHKHTHKEVVTKDLQEQIEDEIKEPIKAHTKKVKNQPLGQELKKDKLFPTDQTWSFERKKGSLINQSSKKGGFLPEGKGDVYRFGSNVKTWDGQDNIVDAVQVDTFKLKRRHIDDASIDKGRVKKVKTAKIQARQMPKYIFDQAHDRKMKAKRHSGEDHQREYVPPTEA